MDKVAIWEKKMEQYYSEVTAEQFKHDLEKAGFEVSKSTENTCEIEVALTSHSDEMREYEPLAVHSFYNI